MEHNPISHNPTAARASQAQSGENTEDTPPLSEKNTKAELLRGYETLLKRYEEKVRGKTTERAQKVADAQVVERVGAFTLEAMLHDMDALKLQMDRALGDLAQAFRNEQKRLEDTRRAISIEEERLKDLHDIETTAVNLEALIKAQEMRRETFEAETELLKRSREREEEEYAYQRAEERKREERERAEREEILKKREALLQAQEEEISLLKKKVEDFPKELEAATAKACQETEASVRKELESQTALIAKEVEGEKKVLATRLASLEELALKQQNEIAALKKELELANRQVQSIAEKAIESSSGKQTLKAVSDIALQQAGRPRTET